MAFGLPKRFLGQQGDRRDGVAPPLPAADVSSYAVYFDWITNLRTGGPPGYLANLQKGLKAIGKEDAISFIIREETADAPKPRAQIRSDGPLVSRVTGGAAGGTEAASARDPKRDAQAREDAAFLSRHDWLHVSPENLRRLDPQARNTIHVHTTVDLLKLHNSLKTHGARHRVKLLLTSHCPEIPAKEWAEKAYSEGASQETAELYYQNHRELDYLAFHAADILVFPCRDAMEPYLATMPDFKKVFGQRDVRFLPTGANALTIDKPRSDMRISLGLQQKFVACYMGRHNRVKGYDVLSACGTALLERHEDLAFLIGGKEGPLPSVRHDRWIEYGWTTAPGDLLNAADVFVLPNQQTYFDLMLLEVLSTGRMVIASRTGGNRYFEGLSEGILLYDTQDELQAAIETVKAMAKGERDRREAQNRALYAERFTPAKFAESYLDLLAEIERDYRLVPDAPVPKGTIAPSENVTRLKANSNAPAPKVSVIVPVYNVEPYLERCLQTIAAQTLTDFEALIVNDGSTDHGPAIIDTFVAKDPRFVRIDQDNQGLSAARNTGLDHARGQFISFVDSDDLLAPTMLERLVAACERTDTRVAVCGVTHIDEREKVVGKTTSFIEDGIVYPKWQDGTIEATLDTLTAIYPSAWNKLYDRRLFDGLRYDHGLYYEDHPVFYKTFLTQDRFAYVNDPLYLHRESGDGRITRDGSRRALDIFTVLDMIESAFRTHTSCEETRRALAKVITRLVWERHWVVKDPALRFKLAENAVMRYEALGLSRDDIRRFQDRIIAQDFIDQLYDMAGVNGGWGVPQKRLTPLADLVTVRDATPDPVAREFPMVVLERNQNFVLVHPQNEKTTVAEIDGLGFFGPGRISFSVCVENDDAGEILFAARAAPFTILDVTRHERESDPVWSDSSDWIALKPFEPKTITLDIPEGAPTLTLYAYSRLADGATMDFGWVRMREIQVELSDTA